MHYQYIGLNARDVIERAIEHALVDRLPGAVGGHGDAVSAPGKRRGDANAHRQSSAYAGLVRSLSVIEEMAVRAIDGDLHRGHGLHVSRIPLALLGAHELAHLAL